METIVNKVAESNIITLDLSTFLPNKETIAVLDIKPFLFMEMIVKEKDFRAKVQEYDWSVFQNKHVAIFCSVDAIIPMWAYMLITSQLSSISASVFFGTEQEVEKKLILENLDKINPQEYLDKRVVLKGCGDVAVPEIAYTLATFKLMPVVKSLMYGEPCSTVPIFKRK